MIAYTYIHHKLWTCIKIYTTTNIYKYISLLSFGPNKHPSYLPLASHRIYFSLLICKNILKNSEIQRIPITVYFNSLPLNHDNILLFPTSCWNLPLSNLLLELASFQSLIGTCLTVPTTINDIFVKWWRYSVPAGFLKMFGIGGATHLMPRVLYFLIYLSEINILPLLRINIIMFFFWKIIMRAYNYWIKLLPVLHFTNTSPFLLAASQTLAFYLFLSLHNNNDYK